MALLRLIRFPNLLIVALTQGLLYFALLRPVLLRSGVSPVLTTSQFVLFILVTVLLTATGYIINDLIDLETDQLNKPDRVIIGRSIPRASAIRLYVVLGVAGLLLAFYLGLTAGRLALVSLYPLSFSLLLLYSTHLKREALLGNIVVALFCGGVAAVIWLAEQSSLHQLFRVDPLPARQVQTLLIWYTVFAFLSTLYREIIKDMEDAEGDARTRCQTAPIRWGMATTKIITGTVGLALLFFLLWQGWQWRSWFSSWVLLFLFMGLVLPMLISFYLLAFAKNRQQFHRLSTLVKVIMLNGLLLILFANL